MPHRERTKYLDREFDVGRQVEIYRSAEVYAADEIRFLDGCVG